MIWNQMIWNLPNLLTCLRGVIALGFLFFSLQGSWLISFWLFTAGALTDMVDGALARLLRQKTAVGAFLDPVADKLLMLFGFLSLTRFGLLPLWLTLVVVARDLMISGGVFFFWRKKIAVVYRPTLLSKMTTLFQILTLLGALWAASYGSRRPGYEGIIAGGLTLASGIQYFIMGLKILNA